MSKTKMTLLFGTSNTTHSDVWRIQSLPQKQSTPFKKNINCTNNTRETNKRRHIGLSLLIAVATLIGIVGCPSPPNNTVATPTSAKQALRLDTTNKTLTLLLNKEIKSIQHYDNISVHKKSKNTPDSTKNKLAEDKHTASIVNGKLVITLKDELDELTAGESFSVHLQRDTIIYQDDTSNAHPITSSMVTVPTIFVTKVEIDKTKNTFTVLFNTHLSGKDDSNIELYKGEQMLASDQYTVSELGTKNEISTLDITFNTNIESGIYTVKFHGNAFKVDTTPNTAFEIRIDTIGPKIEGTIEIDVTTKTLMVFFNKTITKKNDNKIEVYKGKNPLTLSNDYTVAIDDTDTTKVNITLKAAELDEGDKYKVQFKRDAVQGTNGIGNDTINPKEVSVLFPPALASNGLALKGKTLIVTFKKEIKITDNSKITVYKGKNPLTLSKDYTVAIDNTDTTKVNITLKAAELDEGDKYKVQFKRDAVQGTNGIGNDTINPKEVSVLFPPALVSNGLALKGKTLIVTFKKEIKIIDKNKIEVYKNKNLLTLSNDYTVAIDNTDATKVNITLKAAELDEGDKYKVQFKRDAVQGTNGIGNDTINPKEVSVLFPPALASNGLALKGKTLIVTFKKEIKITDNSKITVYKGKNPLTLSKDYSVAIDSADATKINITLKAAELDEGDKYKVQFKRDAVQDTNDIGNDVITTNEVSVLLPPALASNGLALKGKTLIVTFKKEIKITDNSKITVYKGKKPLTLSKDYSVAIDSADATKINITLKAAELDEGDTYKVQFKRDAVQDTNDIGNDVITTNEVSVLLPPALASNGLALKGKTLIVTFKKEIKITDNSKITVYKGKNPLTLSKDYSVAIDSADATKVNITLKAAELTEGDKYKVQFKRDAVQDTNDIGNDVITTNEVSVLLPPALVSNDLVLKGNTLIVTFKKAIKAIDKNKIEVYKGNTLLTSSDYTVVIGDTLSIGYTDKTKVNITLKAAPSLNQTYQVKFMGSAVQDIANNQPNKFMETNKYVITGIWKRVARSADWSRRWGHTTVVFGGKLWVLGGHAGNRRNDVWSSKDGKTWTEVTDDAGWTNRLGHTTVVFDDKLWVLGGYRYGDSRKNDVWSSKDGKTWTEVTDDAGWTNRRGHTTVVFDGKIWVLGGFSRGGKNLHDVWSSKDGKTWTEVTDHADWTARREHTTVVFDGKIWVLGGKDHRGDENDSSSYKNDVWSSSNGKDWTLEKKHTTGTKSWLGRRGHTTVVFQNKIWVLGGLRRIDHSDIRKNDVWSSKDGKAWTKVTDDAGWLGRWGHTTVVFQNKIWVLGGWMREDVWTYYGLP